MKKYILIIGMTILTVVFCLSFIDSNDSSTANSNLDESITYGVYDIPSDLKNISELTSSDKDILCAVSRGLVAKNNTNEIVPCLAEDIIQSSDGIQYEFKIRDDIYWSDGSNITAKDIAMFFKELIKEEKEENIKELLNVYGVKNFLEGSTTFNQGVAITYTNNSVIMRLNNKDDKFLEELTKPQYRLRKYIIMWENLYRNYSRLVYSGDYKISDISKNKLVLKKNTTSDSKFKYINLVKDSSAESSMAAYEVKERDIVKDPPESELSKLNKEKKLVTLPKTEASYVVINDVSMPLQGRREIYKDICKSLEEYESLNDIEFELAEGCYFRENKDDLNKVQARKVSSNIEEYWEKPSIITIVGKDNKQNRTLCKIIKQWFLNNKNITVKYSLLKDEEFKDSNLKKKYDLILINNESKNLSKEEFYTDFEEYMTKRNTDLLESTEINDYYGQYSELEESLFNNYNILPLVFYNENIAISDKISNLNIDGNGNIDFSNIE